MLKRIREIHFLSGTKGEGKASLFLRVVLFFVVFCFIADALNLDVLFAAATGAVSFEDNPAILDSVFDTTPVHAPEIVQNAQLTLPAGKKTVSKNVGHIFDGTIIAEDVDSPTVLDASTSDAVVCQTLPTLYTSSEQRGSTVITFDRTTRFLCILI
jgi:hypothetical protein